MTGLGSCGFRQKERLNTTVSVVNQLTKQHIVVKRPNQQTILVNERSCSKWQFFSVIRIYFTNFVVGKCYPECWCFSEIDLKNLRRTGMTEVCAVECCIRCSRDSRKPNFSRPWINVDVVSVWININFLFGFKKNSVIAILRKSAYLIMYDSTQA